MLTYTSRSLSAARLLISTTSPSGVVPMLGEVVVVLGVVLVERAARMERVVDAIAERVAQLVLVHPAVQAEGGDDVHVVDARLGGEVEHRLDHALAGVGRAHLRQRQADVVERDRQLHAGEQQRRQRILSRAA